MAATRGTARVTVCSAGSAPGDEINPGVAQILSERGLDVSREFPKPLTGETACSADVIMTMGCGDACPVYPGKCYLDWDLPDPPARAAGKREGPVAGSAWASRLPGGDPGAGGGRAGNAGDVGVLELCAVGEDGVAGAAGGQAAIEDPAVGIDAGLA
jgi:hypothetical protein